MAFKFTLLSLERKKDREDVKIMVKRKPNKLQKALKFFKVKKGKSWNKCLIYKWIKKKR